MDDEVLSIRVDRNSVEIAVRQDWEGPVLLLKESVLFATADELVLRHLDGSEIRFDLTGAESISSMDPHYAAIRVGDATYALRMDPGREQLFLLPGSTP